MTIPQAFQIASQHHQIGRLAEAEALYHQILAAQPDHAEALHLLGVVAHQTGRNALAVDLIRKAILLTPENSFACFNLAEAGRAIGRLDEAIAMYRRAIELKPDLPQIHNNLGIALAEGGKLDESIAAYRSALQLDPGIPEIHNNLGNALRENGQFDEAAAACRRAIALKPAFPEAHNNLGAALAGLGQLDEAVTSYRNALQRKPNYPEALNNLGGALKERGQFDEAVAAYRRAIELRPGYPEAYNNLGNALADRGQLEDAMAAYRRALEFKRDYPEAHNHLGVALKDVGLLEKAIAAFHRAIELRPGYPEAYNNLGTALRNQGRPDEAVAAFHRALELKPDYTDALNNLGATLIAQGQLDEAISSFRQALRIKPDDAPTHSNLVFALQFDPKQNTETISEERRRWNRQFGDPMKRFQQPHANQPDPEKPLRIGYVSPDFRDHPVGRYLLPLFERHDRKRFEILCYSDVAQPDTVTEQIRELADVWRKTAGVPDARLAEMIREDRVDILVDLAQHTAGNRLRMFARRPAPVQVSFMGYPESTGLEAIDCRISDRHLEPRVVDEEIGQKERVRLIDSFWCYDPCAIDIAINPLPALQTGGITFGSLGKFSKINASVLQLWARVLGTVKNSQLLMWSPEGSRRRRMLEALEREGIEARRVEFVENRPRREYLELYHRVDIVLDTFPYNGHTTSLDALWMGAPVVSLAGETPVSRAGVSHLTNLGLPELAARSEEDYINIAANLAGDLPRLAQLRSTLRERMNASILMDAPHFACEVEREYRAMWREWCAGQSSAR